MLLSVVNFVVIRVLLLHLFILVFFALIIQVGLIAILLFELFEMAVHVQLVRPEPLRLLTLRFDEVNHVHDDLLEHQHREKETAHIYQFLIDESCPAHTQIAVEKAECV